MRTRWQVLGLVTLAAVLVACTGPAPTPTPTPKPVPTATYVPVTTMQSLVGVTWHGQATDGLYQRFTEDGTLVSARSLESLSTGGEAACSARFEGDQLILIETSAPFLPSCGAAVGKYQVLRLPSGDVRFMALGDACEPRRRSMAQVHKPVP